jgi:hypothetical protein
MNRRLALVTALAVSLVAAGSAQAHNPHARKLSAIAGEGAGKVAIETKAGTVGFSAKISVSVHGAAPDTTFYIQRAPEVGRPLGEDGICQRGSGLFPWEQPNSAGFMPAPTWVSFPRPLEGELKTLSTGPGGSGHASFVFDLPMLADGTVFDVQFRLVDSLTAPTTDLRSGCLTVTVE